MCESRIERIFFGRIEEGDAVLTEVGKGFMYPTNVIYASPCLCVMLSH
jgi:hypothetical protein